MKITLEWLKQHQACIDGYEWSVKRLEDKDGEDAQTFIQALIDEGKEGWAVWTMVRAFDYTQRVKWAVFLAELVIEYYEAKYPNDDRPRKAIEAAKKCIENPSVENKRAAAVSAANSAYASAYAAASYASSAASAAYASSYAAYAAASSSSYAAYAAYAAASSSSYAAYAAYASVSAVDAAASSSYASYAAYAAYASVSAVDAARQKTVSLIFNFGFSLLKESEQS